MYTPKAFEVEDLTILHAAMKQSELATLVTTTTRGLVATHLPLLLDETKGEYGTLTGHVSRANLQWRDTDSEAEALIIFLGLDTYVSPSWYPAKQETGRVVPTWNYAAIHAYGRLTFFEDAERLRTVVTELTKRHEASFPQHLGDLRPVPDLMQQDVKDDLTDGGALQAAGDLELQDAVPFRRAGVLDEAAQGFAAFDPEAEGFIHVMAG